jgi:hypothetical protein
MDVLTERIVETGNDTSVSWMRGLNDMKWSGSCHNGHCKAEEEATTHD